MLCAVNRTLRRQRRRAAIVMTVLCLAGAIVTAHSVLNHDHIGDAFVACLAVVETAVVALGATLALAACTPRVSVPASTEPGWVPAPSGGNARAGPPLLQVFRL